ncbi:Putative bacterial hemoglobin [Rhodovulum sp. P5]|uniref:globin family protein n=1 Tax=Rhodovulum sp. P5 TaxID=1564506 RepID=UPI0009C1D4F7|nr:globin family protein [Rhodovulum sp. P5]ARE40370.1 Putative bacterial hemoglobin [Rhodovulum sp. P5]
MTPQQISLVRESFAKVIPMSEDAAHIFYGRLFEIAPQTRGLFHGDMDEQGRKLIATLAAVVDGLDRLDEIVPVAEALAVRHVGYGVKREDYAPVGTALIYTLSAGLDHEFAPETKAAWSAAYDLLSATMTAAAYPHAAE